MLFAYNTQEKQKAIFLFWQYFLVIIEHIIIQR